MNGEGDILFKGKGSRQQEGDMVNDKEIGRNGFQEGLRGNEERGQSDNQS